jgi:hypothetical protein
MGACGFYSHQAETLDTPFPAELVKLDARPQRCGGAPPHCDINYSVRVTNPTDRDANVLECQLIGETEGSNPVTVGLVIGFPPGTWVPAGTTRTGDGYLRVPVGYSDLGALQRRGSVTCSGLDWHGHAPF